MKWKGRGISHLCDIFEQVILSQRDIHLCFFRDINSWKINCDFFCAIMASSLASKVAKRDVRWETLKHRKIAPPHRKLQRVVSERLAMKRLKFRLAMRKKKHSPWPQTSFRLTEFENRVSFSARIHPPAGARVSPRRPPLSPLLFFSLPRLPAFRRALSYLYFHLLSAFLGVLHAPACTTYPPLGWRGVDSFELAVAVASLAILPQFSTSRRWASELVQIPMRPQEQRKPITDSSCAIS